MSASSEDLGEADEEESVFLPPGVAHVLTNEDIAWYLSARRMTREQLVIELLTLSDAVDVGKLCAPQACVLCRKWHGSDYKTVAGVLLGRCERTYGVRSTDRLRYVDWHDECARMFREYFGLFRLLGEPWEDGVHGHDMVRLTELVLRSKRGTPYLDAVVALRHGLGDEVTAYDYVSARTLDPNPRYTGHTCLICGAGISTGGALSAHVKGHDNYVRRAITNEAKRPRKSRAVLRLHADHSESTAPIPRKSERVSRRSAQPKAESSAVWPQDTPSLLGGK